MNKAKDLVLTFSVNVTVENIVLVKKLTESNIINDEEKAKIAAGNTVELNCQFEVEANEAMETFMILFVSPAVSKRSLSCQGMNILSFTIEIEVTENTIGSIRKFCSEGKETAPPNEDELEIGEYIDLALSIEEEMSKYLSMAAELFNSSLHGVPFLKLKDIIKKIAVKKPTNTALSALSKKEKKCPRCGSKKIKEEIKVELESPLLFTYCADCKTRIKIEGGDRGVDIDRSKYGDEEWVKYMEEFNIDSEFAILMKYLWVKKSKNKIVLDVSSENIERCERIYKENPEDENALYRILILKVALGEETKELLAEFLKATEGNRAYDFLSHFGVDICGDNRFLDALKPHFPNIKKFLMWFIEKRPEAINFVSRHNITWEDLSYLIPVGKIIGIQSIFRLIDIERILKDRLVIGEGFEDSITVAYAEFCYKEKRWLDAYRVCELLLDLNKRLLSIHGEGIFGADDSYLLDHFSGLISEFPTIEEIQNRCLECLKKTVEVGDTARVFKLLSKRLELIGVQEKSISEKEKQIVLYLKIYNIFQEVIKENYDAAYNIWKDWEDRKNVKLIGLKDI